jgi:hypothetical protein
MNKHATPRQLELTAGKTREELLKATAPHIDFEGPAFKESLKAIDEIEVAEAATAVLGKTVPPLDHTYERFDWSKDNDCVILHEQPATAVYLGGGGHLVIRQTNGLEDDVTLLIAPQNITAFLEATAKRARE